MGQHGLEHGAVQLVAGLYLALLQPVVGLFGFDSSYQHRLILHW